MGLALGLALAPGACGPELGYRAPRPLTGYEYLVLGSDALSDGLARGMEADGLRVARVIAGGNRPAAAVLVFEDEARLDVRVVDTRSGVVVAAVSVERGLLPMEEAEAGEALGRIVAQAIRRPPES